jgi:hypothetical protein
MTKDYYVEAKFGKTRWTLVKHYKTHKDALEYVKDAGAVKYPLRVVRVVRTVIFGESK